MDSALPPLRHEAAHSSIMYAGFFSHSPAAAHTPQCSDLSGGPSSGGGCSSLAFLAFFFLGLHVPGHFCRIRPGLFSHSPSSFQLSHSSLTQLPSAPESLALSGLRGGASGEERVKR